MLRALIFLFVCVGLSAGLVTYLFELPKLSTADKKVIWKSLLTLAVAALMFFAFVYLLKMDNNHNGVLQ